MELVPESRRQALGWKGPRALLDQSLLGFLQRHQTVALFLGHQESVRFQLPSVPLSTGHFYLARIGHYHFAATSTAPPVHYFPGVDSRLKRVKFKF
jgi:hypothetical protein